MSTFKSLAGQILVSQPKNNNGHFQKSVIIIAQHGPAGAWGVVVNKEAPQVGIQTVMSAAGIDYPEKLLTIPGKNGPVYMGGPVEQTRVHVVHTMDWFSNSTIQITSDLGITGEMSVLAAIAQDEGPEMWRVGVGLAAWSAGQLDGEQSGIPPWTTDHQWLTTKAATDLVLSGSGEEQWQRAIEACVNNKIAELF
jgi:putative transcriptional regulator